MRLPTKLNDAFWPKFLRKFIGQNLRSDPRVLYPVEGESVDTNRITQAISSFKFGTTFKTTADQRHFEADTLLLENSQPKEKLTILDIGASDGITSLNLMERLNFEFEHYYVTDYNLSVHAIKNKNKVFFFDQNDTCILIASPLFVYYPNHSFRLKKRFKIQVDQLLKSEKQKIKIDLIQTELQRLRVKDDRIQVLVYDVQEPWKQAQPNLIKVANLLNPGYFTEAFIQKAVHNLYNILPINGRLLIVENRQQLQAGLYSKTEAGFKVINTILKPDIHSLIEDFKV